MKIGIVGNGYVGRSTALLKCEGVEVLIYDKDDSKCEPSGTRLKDLARCDLIFVCVPTPMKPNGECGLRFVRGCIEDLINAGVRRDKIILRSTVPVGTSDYFGVNYMPEFITEKNWEEDFKFCKQWIVGLENPDCFSSQKVFNDLFGAASKAGKIKSGLTLFCTTKEAELIKNCRNAFLATKVSFFSEIESFCQAKGIDYNMVRGAVTLDDRITDSHTMIPGHDGKRGYGGTCFPKDINSLSCQFKSAGVPAPIIEASIFRNENIDRKEKDWESNKGRSIL